MSNTLDFIPRSEPAQILWLQNYSAQLPSKATLLGLSEEDVAAQQTAISNPIEKLQGVAQAKKRELRVLVLENQH